MGTQAPIADNNSTVKTTMIGMRVVNSSAAGCVVATDGEG